MAQVIAHCYELNSRTKDVTLDENVTFESLIFNKNILKGLQDSGFKKPSPIQFKAIPVGRCGFDMVVKSKSGTGKTLVYAVIALEAIEIERHEPQVLILAPTREIAVQIQEVLINVGLHFKDLKIEFFIGGLPLEEDKEKCKNCHIAVGAPGRVSHLIRKGILKVNSIHLFVLDEVDKLMESSFMADVNEIFNSLPDRKQIITASATYPKELYTYLCRYMLSPVYIEVETETPLLLGLKQFVKLIEPHTSVVQEIKFKNEALLDLFSTISFTQCLIFTNYQTRAESISNFLNQKGWSSMYISAAQTQTQRLKTMKDLKNFQCKILLTTDLAARGIDAANVDLVINYDVPIDAVTYLHRMGRTGRYGSLGVCIDLVSCGPPLTEWQNILGGIGGCSLGIPILPKLNGTVADLLKAEVSAENCIFGTIPNQKIPELNVSIKKNVLDMKQKFTKVQCSNEEEFTIDLQEGNENVNVNKADVNNKRLVEVDDSFALKTSATGDAKSNIKFSDTPFSAFTLEQNRKITNHKSQVPRNTLNNLVNSSLEMSKKCIFDKNRALLCVTEIISNNKCTDDLKSEPHVLQNYLNAIKNSDKNDIFEIMARTKSRLLTDLLENVDKLSYTQKENLIDEDAVKTNTERIFDFGYQYATKSNCKHWSTYLPNSELTIYNSISTREEKDLAKEINTYTENAYGMEEDSDTCDMKNESSDELVATKYFEDNVDEDNSNSQLKWVPIEKLGNVNKQSESSNWENLASYFNQCSETLWQNGLCFETIEDFDNWYYQEWQAQVLDVRNYIQQNIYIQGMNHYKESKYNQNKE